MNTEPKYCYVFKYVLYTEHEVKESTIKRHIFKGLLPKKSNFTGNFTEPDDNTYIIL